MTLVHEEVNPLAVDLLMQSAAKKEISEGNHYTTCTIVFKLVQYRKQKWRNAQQLWKEGTLKKKGPLSRHLTMHCNHLVYDSSIFWGEGGRSFIGNYVYKALKVKCTCAMHVYMYVNNSYNLNMYLTSRLCAHLYQRWHKRNGPNNLER